MAIRRGKQLLQSLQDGRQLFIDGERVEDVTTDPRFTAAALSLAELYDMQHDPAARYGEDLGGRDLRDVWPQPRLHEHFHHRLRLGGRRIRQERQEVRRKY